MTAARGPADIDGAAEANAIALLRLYRATPATASHLAAAIAAHRRDQRRLGSSIPVALDALEQVFATIAVSSQRVRTGHEGAELDHRADPLDSGVHDDDGAELLTRPQAARRLRCSVATVKRREAAGALTPVRDGRIVRHRVEDLENYIASHTSEGTP